MYLLAHGSNVASQIATYQQDPSICISGSVPSHLYSRSLPVSHCAWWQKHSCSLSLLSRQRWGALNGTESPWKTSVSVASDHRESVLNMQGALLIITSPF